MTNALVSALVRLVIGAVLGWLAQMATDVLASGWCPATAGSVVCAAWGPVAGAVLGALSKLGYQPKATPVAPRASALIARNVEPPPPEPERGPDATQDTYKADDNGVGGGLMP